MMMYTDFLTKIENKVNIVLKEEASYYKFDKNMVLSWEDWRRNFGYAKKGHKLSEMGFSLILLIIYVIISLSSISLRLAYLFISQQAESIAFMFLIIGVVILFIIIAIFLIMYYRKIAKETQNYIFNTDKYIGLEN